MIRVTVADDQALVRSGISALLRTFEHIDVVSEADDGERAIEAVRESKPDVLLLDVRMPKLSGIEAIERMSRGAILPPTLLLTTFEDPYALVAGLKAGARGYLLKGVRPEVLVEAIETVANGGTYLFAPALTAPEAAGDAPSEKVELTPRERDVLALLTSGVSNRDIAEALSLTEGTVRNHVSNIFVKLGVRDRTSAVLQALSRRLV